MAGAAGLPGEWQRATVPASSGTLAYRRGGGGPRRLLYLHDAGADTLGSAAFDDLAADHDVVLLDLPGYGDSTPPGPMDSPEGIADLLAECLDGLGWADAVVAGTSLGGWFAMELAIRHPTRVRALVLADAAGLHCPESYLFALFCQGQAAAGAQRLIAQAIWDRLPAAEGATDDADVGAAVWGPWVQELAAAAWCSWHPYTENPRLLGLLPRIGCPVRILWGARDALIPLRHGRLLAQGIPGATLEIVDGVGHLLPMEAPERFASAIRRVSSP